MSATSASFTSRVQTERWGLEETKKFYEALQRFGTDFTLMQSAFPGRTQRQLKNKFKKEEKAHRALVTLALQPNIARPLPSAAPPAPPPDPAAPPPPEAAADDLDDASWAVDWDDPGEDLAGAAADLWRRHPAARAEAEGGARDGPVARDDGDHWTLTPVRGAAVPQEEAPPQPADDDGLFYTLVGVVAVTVLACRAAS